MSNISAGGGGRIEEVVICIWVDKLDHTARSPTTTTPQSTSAHGGRGWNGWGMAWRHCFFQGILVEFFGGGQG